MVYQNLLISDAAVKVIFAMVPTETVVIF